MIRFQCSILLPMGCSASSSTTSVPINNSLIHLLHSGQTNLVIQRLEQEGASFDLNSSFNFRGDTLLHYACSKNDLKLVKYLLSKGANQEAQNSEGQFPVDVATDSEIIKLMPAVSRPQRKVQQQQIAFAPKQLGLPMSKSKEMNGVEKKSPVQPHYRDKLDQKQIKVTVHQPKSPTKQRAERTREDEDSNGERNKRREPGNIFDVVERESQLRRVGNQRARNTLLNGIGDENTE